MLIPDNLCEASWKKHRQTFQDDKFPCKREVTSTRHNEGVEVTAQRVLAFKSCRETVQIGRQFCAKLHWECMILRVNNLIRALEKKNLSQEIFLIKATIIVSPSEDEQFCCYASSKAKMYSILFFFFPRCKAIGFWCQFSYFFKMMVHAASSNTIWILKRLWEPCQNFGF